MFKKDRTVFHIRVIAKPIKYVRLNVNRKIRGLKKKLKTPHKRDSSPN